MVGASRLTSLTTSLLERVRDRFPSEPMVVALSGGADSAVCAWAAREIHPRVRAVTVDHGLPASGVLVEAAARIASGLALEHGVLAVGGGDTTEAGLRTARYAALESDAADGEVLVSGHTADDQAETVLGNLLRGTGASGLGGMPSSRGRWHRPLLGLSREETRAAAAELGLPFVDDPGNTDPAIRRSRIRTEVIPYLASLNPSIRDALLRTARLAVDDEAVLDARAASIPVIATAGEVRIAAAALAAVPVAVASRAVRRGLRMLLHPYPGDFSDVAAVLSVSGADGSAVSISTGLIAVREGPWVTIHSPEPADVPAAVGIPVPGTLRFGRWQIASQAVEAAPVRSLSRRVVALPHPGGDLVVRVARPGDAISMGEGSKSVAEALREAAVPVRFRSVWPVVEQAGRMVWVVGSRHAAGATAVPGSPAVVLRASEDM